MDRASGPPSSPAPRPRWTLWLAVATVAVAIWAWWASPGVPRPPEVDYSQALDWIALGKVKSVEIDGPRLDGVLDGPQAIDGGTTARFRTVRPEADEQLLPLLREKRVRMRVVAGGTSWPVRALGAVLPWLLLVGLWVWLSRRGVGAGGGLGAGALGGFLRRGKRFERRAEVGETFDQVAGLAAAKRDLHEIVEFLREPARFARLGGRIPRGVLLVGPPGTGKTLVARAVAGEASVPFYSIGGSEFIEMYVGVGAARVRDLFAEAKKNGPAIVFIDELDAVGRVRGAGLGGGHDEREQTVDQLLSEMDGFERSDLVVVLAATNRPDVLDPALLRPGRFDRRVVIGLPELAARRESWASTSPASRSPATSTSRRSRRPPPASAAPISANLVNEAALIATRRRADALEQADLTAAYDRVVLGEPGEAVLTPAEKERVAIHEAGHAVAAWATPGAAPPRRVSILPRGMALGATQQAPGADRHVLGQAELEARLTVFLGGYAAEQVALGGVSTGSEQDLREATALATRMVAHFGMSEEWGRSTTATRRSTRSSATASPPSAGSATRPSTPSSERRAGSCAAPWSRRGRPSRRTGAGWTTWSARFCGGRRWSGPISSGSWARRRRPRSSRALRPRPSGRSPAGGDQAMRRRALVVRGAVTAATVLASSAVPRCVTWLAWARLASVTIPSGRRSPSITGRRRSWWCFMRAVTWAALSLTVQETSSLDIASATTRSQSARPWVYADMQMSRSVSIPTTRPLSSTTGTAPQS